jgi:hypothetical protein
MFSLIYVELKPTWVPVGSSAYRHQVHEGHRWSINHVSPEKIERLVLLLRGVGTITEKLQAYPASIEVVSTLTTSDAVDRINDILDKVFG